MKRKFAIFERVSGHGSKGPWTGTAEIIQSYPDFKSVEEAFEYIHDILDPGYTGHYGVVINQDPIVGTD